MIKQIIFKNNYDLEYKYSSQKRFPIFKEKVPSGFRSSRKEKILDIKHYVGTLQRTNGNFPINNEFSGILIIYKSVKR